MAKKIKNIADVFLKSQFLLLVLLVVFSAFFRFYEIGDRSPFGWDQVDNAWAAKNIIVDHKYPLVGMQAKLNSGIFIGPIYYYLISFFYFLTNLDPLASSVFALVSSVVNSIVLYVVLAKIFNRKVAFTGVFINAISLFIILQERVQWPVNFIPTVSLLIFYFLYRIICGESKYFIYLGLALGFSFSIHFTSAFYPLIIILCLPFVKFNWQTVKYMALSVLLCSFFLIPNILYELKAEGGSTKNISLYLSDYSHGFHLRRMAQLGKDAFIEFEDFFPGVIKPIKYFLVPISFFFLYKDKKLKGNFKLYFLIIVWFFIPWIAFSIYKGEITNYYFSATRPIVIMIVAYLTVKLLEQKNFIVKLVLICFWAYLTYSNLTQFFKMESRGLDSQKKAVLEKIKQGEKIEFMHGVPESYLYYIYTRQIEK